MAKLIKPMQLPIKYSKASPYMRKKARMEYIRLQKGLCQYCNEPLDKQPLSKVMNATINTKLFPTGFFDWPIHLHHDHNTDDTIGAVHARCNAYLWQYLGE